MPNSDGLDCAANLDNSCVAAGLDDAMARNCRVPNSDALDCAANLDGSCVARWCAAAGLDHGTALHDCLASLSKLDCAASQDNPRAAAASQDNPRMARSCVTAGSDHAMTWYGRSQNPDGLDRTANGGARRDPATWHERLSDSEWPSVAPGRDSLSRLDDLDYISGVAHDRTRSEYGDGLGMTPDHISLWNLDMSRWTRAKTHSQ